MDKKSKILGVVLGGVMIATSFVLSYVKIPWLPFGGSVTLFSMVPVILVACIYGNKWGLMVCGTYSILQLIQSVSSSSSFILDTFWKTFLMIILDFILAFTVLGFAGTFVTKNSSEKSLPFRCALGTFLAVNLRYLCHIASGYILWGEYAEWFFGEEYNNALGQWAISSMDGKILSLFYSVVYNGLYMIPEIIISTAGVFALVSIAPVKTAIKKSRI